VRACVGGAPRAAPPPQLPAPPPTPSPPPSRAADWRGKVCLLLADVLRDEWNECLAWWLSVRNRVAGWEGWDGKIARYVPSASNADYAGRLAASCERFLGPRGGPAFREFWGEAGRWEIS
jgi:hypothetical protein